MQVLNLLWMKPVRFCVTLPVMNDLHDRMRAWLHEVLDHQQVRPNGLARLTGVSPTTLTRVLNDPKAKHTLSATTIDAIVRATGYPPPDFAGSEAGNALHPLPPAQGQELDGLKLPAETGDARIDDAVRFLCQADDNFTPWRLNTRALEGLGYLPGDVVIVDLAQKPEAGDVVVAQIYKARGADTVFRLYAKPFLTAAANDRVMRPPLLVDDDRVAIRGTVIAMFRPHRGHLQAA
jgi:hypothetical protein